MSIHNDMKMTMTEIQDMVEDFMMCFEDDITSDMQLDLLSVCAGLEITKDKCVPPAPVPAPTSEVTPAIYQAILSPEMVETLEYCLDKRGKSKWNALDLEASPVIDLYSNEDVELLLGTVNYASRAISTMARTNTTQKAKLAMIEALYDHLVGDSTPEPVLEVTPEPVSAPKVESTLKVAPLTHDNYVVILNELLLKLTHEGDYDFFEECIEEAWALGGDANLNKNLEQFEKALSALRLGNYVETVVQSNSATPPPQPAAEEIDMSLFDNYTWFRDEDHNGDPKAIFTHALQIDPTTCTLKDFVHGLSYARTNKDGKACKLTSKELADLVMDRGTFTDAVLPTRKNGDFIKTKVWPIIRDAVADLKDEHNTTYDKKALKDLTRHSYQTSAFYREEFLDDCVTPTETPTADLDGDTLDELALNVDVNDLKMNIGYTMGQEEQELEAPLTAMEILMRD
jgi:hypothetical protein